MSRNARRIIFLSIIFILIAGIVFLILKLVLPSNTNQNKSDTPDKNNSNIYTVVADNVDIDDSTGLSYVNNEILLNVTEDTSREDIERIVSQYDGVIVGYIDSVKQYQIELGSDHSYAELDEIGKALTSFDEISSSGINHVMYLESNSIPPNDSIWKNEWNDDIGGKNWGVEAIQAPKMWELMNNVPVSTVNVGVLDNQFYTDHEDLDFSGVEYNDYNAFAEKSPTHGTHVSGTIAAVSNNDKGIAGVMPNEIGNKKVNLYGVSIEGLKIEDKDSRENGVVGITVSDYEAGLVDLIALKECKVINLSYGGGFGDEGGIIAQQIEDTLQVLINEGNEFLIVKSSGNDRINYEKSDLFSQMHNHNVLDRIITVGATKLRDGEIYLWEGSNYGNIVDIVAPGCDIQSTIGDAHNMFSWTMWISSSYGKSTGTSMAAPHVTGVAAALWSVNLDLSGKEVKQILCDTSTGLYRYESYDQLSTVSIYDREQGKSITHDINENEDYINAYSYAYPMLNAYEAMRNVIGSTEDNNDQEDSQHTPTQVPTEKPTIKPTDPPAQQTIDDNFLIGDWSTSDGVYLSFYDDGTFIMDWGYFPEEEGHWTAEATTDDTLAIEMDGSSILSMMSMLYGNTLTDYHFEILKCNNDNFYLVQVYDDYTARTSKCKLGFTRDGATKNFNYQ